MNETFTQEFSVSDIEAALVRIRSSIVPAPLLKREALNRVAGARVWVMAENLQRTGPFKFRGACNRALQVTAEERTNGVVAFSSGNHTSVLSSVCTQIGAPSTIIMPPDAPRTKKTEGTKDYGATVRLYDSKAIGREIAAYRRYHHSAL